MLNISTVSVLDFHASGDGVTPDTAAIQNAIHACVRNGGGRVIVPPGTYRIGTVFLYDNIELHLEAGAVLRGSLDMTDYCADDAFPQNGACPGEGWRGAHMIAAVGADNVALTGPGEIDGNGAYFMESSAGRHRGNDFNWMRYGVKLHDPGKAALRPGQTVMFAECTRVRIQDITLRNNACWSCFLLGCRNVLVRGLLVENDPACANSDGLSIDNCSGVTVSDCILRTGDDALTIRSSYCARLPEEKRICENIAVTNCVLEASACAIRIGVGTGVIRNVGISGIVVDYAGTGILICSCFGASNGVSFSDIDVGNIRGKLMGDPVSFMKDGKGDARMEKIRIHDFRTNCFGNIPLTTYQGRPPDRIVLQDCEFDVVDIPFSERDKTYDPHAFFEFASAETVELKHCRIIWNIRQGGIWEKALTAKDVRNLEISNDSILPDPPHFP